MCIINLSMTKEQTIILKLGGSVLTEKMSGDMGLVQKNKPAVISADELAALLAKAFSNSKIFFATDIEGVFDKFPPSINAQPLSFLPKKKLKRLLKKMNEQKNQYDVTGGMAGKLKTILVLRKKEVVIFNGLKPGNLTKALTGKPVGTRIIL
ncbi:MAG: hypothetical protein AAB509_03080 [Patescibacteria group bacterium]